VSASRPSVLLVGAGGLGRAILPALRRAGWPVAGVAARTPAAARRAGRPGFGPDPATWPRAGLTLLAVPDREVAGIAALLARDGGPWRGRAVLHHAGSKGLAPLDPLRTAGASVGLLHPFQALGRGPLARTLLPGSRARIEGTGRARTWALRAARDLGLVVVPLGPLGDRERAAWHAAAAVASNDLVALMSLSVRVLERAGLGRDEALAAVVPLARGVLSQLEHGGFADALTGPVVRADLDTVAAHRAVLERLGEEDATVHRLLSRRLVRLAAGHGRLGRNEAAALRRLLD